jgi:hypothetical protein
LTASSDGKTREPLKHRKPGEYRDVPVPSWLWEMVEDMPDGPLIPGNGRLFQLYGTIYFRFMRAAEAAGIDDGFTPHSLRHAFAFAPAMLARGVQITELAHFLGHRGHQRDASGVRAPVALRRETSCSSAGRRICRVEQRLVPRLSRTALGRFPPGANPHALTSEAVRGTRGWWLTGSAALAVRGAPIEPGDIDLVCGVSDAVALGGVFSDALVEPVAPAASESISEWWGRAFCGARIEWIGGPKPWVDDPLPADFGPAAAARLETVAFEDWMIRVPPLDLQRAVNQRRGLTERVAMIDTLSP